MNLLSHFTDCIIDQKQPAGNVISAEEETLFVGADGVHAMGSWVVSWSPHCVASFEYFQPQNANERRGFLVSDHIKDSYWKCRNEVCSLASNSQFDFKIWSCSDVKSKTCLLTCLCFLVEWIDMNLPAACQRRSKSGHVYYCSAERPVSLPLVLHQHMNTVHFVQWLLWAFKDIEPKSTYQGPDPSVLWAMKIDVASIFLFLFRGLELHSTPQTGG